MDIVPDARPDVRSHTGSAVDDLPVDAGQMQTCGMLQTQHPDAELKARVLDCVAEATNVCSKASAHIQRKRRLRMIE